MKKKKAFTLVEVIASIVVIGIVVYAVFSIFISSGFKSVNVEIYTVAQTLAEGKLEELLAHTFSGVSAEGETPYSGDLANYTYQVATDYVSPEALDVPIATTESTGYRMIQVMIRHPRLNGPVTLETVKADYEY